MNFKVWLESVDLNKRLIDKVGNYKVYSVNASSIRDRSVYGDGFNHFATHLEFPSIVPNNEIWISQDIDKNEVDFLIHNGINQYEANRKGIKDTYDYALRREKSEREKTDKINFDPQEKPPKEIYYKLYCTILSDSTKVWLVNGEEVRDVYKTDFILGGNPGPYSWIPENEIWIEKNLKEKGEIDITILHEYVEHILMKYLKFSYAKAHGIATKVDFKHRNKITKQDIESLSPKIALDLAKTYLK